MLKQHQKYNSGYIVELILFSPYHSFPFIIT